MKKFLLLLLPVLCLTLTIDTADARKKVRIYKPSPPVVSQPIAYPLAVVPPVLVAFDIARRTSCDPRVAVGTGPGDPGFDPKGPTVGNFLIPAIYRRECNGVHPTWYKW